MLIVLHKHDPERNPTTWRFQPSYKSPSDDGQSLWFWQRHELFPPTSAAAINDPYALPLRRMASTRAGLLRGGVKEGARARLTSDKC